MKTQFVNVAILALALTFAFTSCEKTTDENGLSDTDIQVLTDDSSEEALSDQVFDEVDNDILELDNSGYDPKKMATKSTVCKTITVDKPDDSNFPKTITIDFGEGCSTVINNDTITKTGKIIVEVTGRYYAEASLRTVTFENLYVNGVKFEGVRSVYSNGYDDEKNFSWDIKLEGGKLIYPDGTIVTREINRTRTRFTNQTIVAFDDYILIEGQVTGTNYRGETYTRKTLEPLKRTAGCNFYVSGILEVSNSNGFLASIDYGDGQCDRFAEVTKGDETKTINLRWWRR